jgi:nitric oxide reductase large subunit
MVFPFLKIAIYLSLGILVILMIVHVFSYITSQDESSKKKSMMVIVWTTIGMLIIS